MHRRRARRSAEGFTLNELLMVMAIIVIVAAMATPQLGRLIDSYRLGIAIREVERELQAARVSAITANRIVRVRFDCPAAGQFRRVEMLGEAGLPDPQDDQLSRCSTESFPYPAPDLDPLTRPNLDGPLHFLPPEVTSSGVSGIEFRPDGTARSDTLSGLVVWDDISPDGVEVEVTMRGRTRSVTVNGMGRVFVQP